MTEVTSPFCNKILYCEVVGLIEEELLYPPLTCPVCGKIVLSIGNVDIADFFGKKPAKEEPNSNLSPLSELPTDIQMS